MQSILNDLFIFVDLINLNGQECIGLSVIIDHPFERLFKLHDLVKNHWVSGLILDEHFPVQTIQVWFNQVYLSPIFS